MLPFSKPFGTEILVGLQEIDKYDFDMENI